MGRPVIAVAAVVTIASGLALRAFVEGPVAKYGGVALWATLVYLLVLLLRPAISIRKAAVIAMTLSFLVEFLQLTPLPSWLSSQHIVLRLIFGTTFHPPDLPAYLAGVLLGALIHRVLDIVLLHE